MVQVRRSLWEPRHRARLAVGNSSRDQQDLRVVALGGCITFRGVAPRMKGKRWLNWH